MGVALPTCIVYFINSFHSLGEGRRENGNESSIIPHLYQRYRSMWPYYINLPPDKHQKYQVQ